jgi:DNA replication protein DnaC
VPSVPTHWNSRTASCAYSIWSSSAKGTSAIFRGNPGVGKTFLAKIIAWRACQVNQRVLFCRVLFTTAMDMLNQPSASQVDHSVIRKLKTYTEPTLLVL